MVNRPLLCADIPPTLPPCAAAVNLLNSMYRLSYRQGYTMKHRLTAEQKAYGVMNVLCGSRYPITPNQIAKSIGFSTGAAVHGALDELTTAGFLTFYVGTIMGHEARYFFPTPAGRAKYCELMGD